MPCWSWTTPLSLETAGVQVVPSVQSLDPPSFAPPSAPTWRNPPCLTTPSQPHPPTLPLPSTLCPCFRSKPFPPHLGPLPPPMPPGPLSAFTLHPPRHLLEPRSDGVDACLLDTFQRSPLKTGQARGVAPPTWSPHLSHLPPCPLPMPTLLPGLLLTVPVQDPHILRIPLHMVWEAACLASSGHSRQW